MSVTFWTVAIDWVLNSIVLVALSQADLSNVCFDINDDAHVKTLLQICVDYGFSGDVAAVIRRAGKARGMKIFNSCNNIPNNLRNNVTSILAEA